MNRARTVATGAVALAAVAGAAVWWALPGPARHGPGADPLRTRAAALSAGRADLTALSSADAHDPAASLKSWLDATTGALHDSLTQGRSASLSALRADGTAATGDVTAAGLTALDPAAGTAAMVATVDVGTTVTGSTAPDVQRRRFDARLELADGRWRISSLTTVPDDAAPQANTDPAAAQVTAQIGPAIAQVLSYAPADLPGTEQAAGRLLGGTAAVQYRALFDRIRQQVTAQQLTLRTTVVRIGVGALTADRAELLVFVDQTAQRAGRPATSVGGQLSVVAQRRDGHWSITQLSQR